MTESTPRLNVLLVLDTLAAGGAERVAVDIANSLDRRTHRVVLCSTRFDGIMRAELRSDVTVELLGRRSTWDLRGMLRFRRLIRRHRIDVVHSHGRGTMKFVTLMRALGLIRTVHLFHDHYGPLHQDRRASWILRAAMRVGVDRYLGVDRRLCSWAIDVAGVPPDRVHLVRSGVDVDRFDDVIPTDLREEFDLGGRDVVLVMIAHIRQQKDHPTVFRALATLPTETREALGLVLVGRIERHTDYYQRCMKMADSLGVRDLLRVAGPRPDVPSLLAGADGAILASKNETGPLAVLEYMASGLPFIATDTGEITRALHGTDTGFLPAPRDHRELAEALTRLVALGPDGRRAMGARGHAVAREQFGQPGVTRQIEQLYRLAIAP